jgi:hypothetical protein
MLLQQTALRIAAKQRGRPLLHRSVESNIETRNAKDDEFSMVSQEFPEFQLRVYLIQT